MNTDYLNINDVLDYPDMPSDNSWSYEYEYWSAINDYANIFCAYGLDKCTSDLMLELSKRRADGFGGDNTH